MGKIVYIVKVGEIWKQGEKVCDVYQVYNENREFMEESTMSLEELKSKYVEKGFEVKVLKSIEELWVI